MKIRYLGHSCFEITCNSGKKIITDPYRGVGYELPQGLCADIVTVSHGHFDHAYTQGVHARQIVDSSAGYADEGVTITGIDSYHDGKQGVLRGNNIIFKINADGVTLCHMGDIGEEYSSALMKKIGEVDILLLPVGGTYTVDAQGAKRYVDGIQPKAVIPMHYRPKDGSLDIADCASFLKLFDGECVLRCGNEVEITDFTHGILYMER